jgi:hypothetical protein
MSKVIVTELDVDIIKPKSGNTVLISGLTREDIDSVDPRSFDDSGEQNALVLAIADIGSDEKTLYIPPDTWTITTDLSIPANINLKMAAGAIFSIEDGVDFSISGDIEAGPYQIFSWAGTGTGTIGLSASPTQKLFAQWWGMLPDGSDCGPFIIKAAAGMNYGQDLHFTEGVWTVSSAVAISKTYGFSMSGDGVRSTLIKLDLDGSTDGFTLGNDTTSIYNLKIRNLSFIGATGSNRIAVKVKQWHVVDFDDVNFLTGSSEWACSIEGCLYVYWKNVAQHEFGFVSAYGANRSTNVFRVITKGGVGVTAYQSNVCHLDVNIDGPSAGYGLYVAGVAFSQSDISIIGTIEGVLDPLYVGNVESLDIPWLYAEANTNGPVFENIKYGRVNGIREYQKPVYFRRCQAVTFSNFYVGSLYIDGSCRSMTIGPGRYSTTNPIHNDAPDTQFIGSITSATAGLANFALTPGSAVQNVLNTYLERWNTTAPDGWVLYASGGTPTAEKCGDDETDTTKHIAPHCMKLTTDVALSSATKTLNSTEIAPLLGQYANFTIWGKIKVGQTFSTYPIIRLNITCPVWADSTAYQTGDGVFMSTGTTYFWKANNAGTSSNTEPVWLGATTTGNTTLESFDIVLASAANITVGTWLTVASGFASTIQQVVAVSGNTVTVQSKATSSVVGTNVNIKTNQLGNLVIDNDIIWEQCIANSPNSNRLLVAADIDSFIHLSASNFIPNNVLTVAAQIYQYQQTAGESVVYWAEPCLLPGVHAPRASILPANNEQVDIFYVNGLAIIADTVIPSNAGSKYHTGCYFKQGDVCHQIGGSGTSKCTVPGTPGTWSAF